MSSLTAFESCLSMAAIHVSTPVIPIALRLWFKRSECTSTCKSTDRRPEWSSLTLTPTRTRESPLSCDKGHDLRAPCRLSVSRGQRALPYLRSYPCHATLRRFLRPMRCRLRFVARLCRDCSRPALSRHKRGFQPALYPIPGFSTHPDYIPPHTHFLRVLRALRGVH